MAEIALNFAKDKLINYVKDELIKQLQEKLKQGDAGIDDVFELIKQNLKSVTVTVPLDKDYNVLDTINKGFCKMGQSDIVKQQIKDGLSNKEFINDLTEKLKEKIPEMTNEIDALPQKIKNKLEILINQLINCDKPIETKIPVRIESKYISDKSEQPPVPLTGGKRNKNTKRKHRKKTKKHYKKSRGRK